MKRSNFLLLSVLLGLVFVQIFLSNYVTAMSESIISPKRVKEMIEPFMVVEVWTVVFLCGFIAGMVRPAGLLHGALAGILPGVAYVLWFMHVEGLSRANPFTVYPLIVLSGVLGGLLGAISRNLGPLLYERLSEGLVSKKEEGNLNQAFIHVMLSSITGLVLGTVIFLIYLRYVYYTQYFY